MRERRLRPRGAPGDQEDLLLRHMPASGCQREGKSAHKGEVGVIHVLDNGRDYSDHRIHFIESPLTGGQLAVLLAFVRTFADDDDGACWYCSAIYEGRTLSLIASGSLDFYQGAPGTLDKVLDRGAFCNEHEKRFADKLDELRR
jgi:hypothetical protein